MYMMTMKPGMKIRKKAAFIVYVSCNIAELFSKETVCEKFQIAREKVVVTVTTVTYKVAPVSKLKTVGHCDGRGLITG